MTGALEKALARAAGAKATAPADAAAQRFVEAAAADGMADVAYTIEASPVGDLFLATGRRGLLQISFSAEHAEDHLRRLSERVSPRVLEAPGQLDSVRRQLDEYFHSDRHEFDVPVDFTLAGEGFSLRILKALQKIPFGETLSYRGIAARAGNDRAMRAAGNALGANPIPIVVPCHRVIRAEGSLGGYGGGPERKRFLLELEGVLE